MMIQYISLARRTERHQHEIREAVCRVADSGWYLLGRELQQFESDYARYVHTGHCVGVGNGLDALTLIYRAYIEMGVMEQGDEVIVPANTYIASILAVVENGLVPVLVEPDRETLQIDDRLIERHITRRTRSVMIVHLYGRCAYTDKIGDLCRSYGLKLVEDNAQAHGCRFDTRPTGSLGDAAGHSFYPTKNLGAMGDAGAVTTDDSELAEVVASLRNYGSERKYVFGRVGRNSRMDELQAAVLGVGLRHLDGDNRLRRALAEYYRAHICHPEVVLPALMPDGQDVWHIYPVFAEHRDRLREYLLGKGVETEVHYPIPPHRQACFPQWHGMSLPVTEYIHAHELSLPIGPELTMEQAQTVVEAINSFEQ